jgi:hypothetical protein
MSSCSEDADSDNESLTTLPELRSWTKNRLQDELRKRRKKISGKKSVLVNRLFKAYSGDTTSDDTDSDSDHDIDVPTSSDTQWREVDVKSIPPVKKDDIDNYFLFRKNPITGRKKKCKRQLKKAKKFAQERNYLHSVLIHDSHPEFTHFRSSCQASMKDQKYAINLTLTKKTGGVYAGICSCKAGQAGCCAHIGALLIRLSDMKAS